LAPGG